LIIDWAEPEKDITFDDYIVHHLAPLLRQIIADGFDIKGIIGYCMGGTIIAALTSAFPEFKTILSKHVLIAPPWDFSYQSIDQMTRLQSLAIQTHVMDDVVPNDFVQSLFWAVDPLQVLKKFRKFPNVTNADRFVRVEDWLNEGRAVSKSVIQTCLFDWYRDNKIMAGEWRINNTIVTLNNMGNDTMIIYGKNDNLVPYDSIKPMKKLLSQGQFIAVDTGHIGLMASDKSRNAAWKPIAEFLKKDKVHERKKS
jgi:polyhydroxyalkanoate synthase subunit PhaC